MTDVEVNEGTPNVPASAHQSWDPFGELETWARRFGHWPALPRWSNLMSAFDDVDFTPLADIEESDDEWTIEVELPGVKKQDVEVETRGQTVVIHGERKEKERDGILRQRRRVTGSFRYEVTLRGDFDADAVTAKLSDGELTVTVPKVEQDQTRKIKIA